MTAQIAVDAPASYYESEHAVLYLDDARNVLPSFAKESFELVVTDPPYGVEFQSNHRKDRFEPIANDRPEDRGVVEEILAECVRLTAQSRHLYVFGPEVLRAAGMKVSAPAPMVWDKATIGGGDMFAPWGPAHEDINFYVGQWRHAGKAGKEVIPVRLRKGSVLRFPRPTGRKVRHPSEKPVALLRELIESSSRTGDTVLDPFAGVGSTGVAAILTGRRCVLVEENQVYADIAVDRLATAERLRDQMASV